MTNSKPTEVLSKPADSQNRRIVAISEFLLRGMERPLCRLSWITDQSVVAWVFLFMTEGAAQQDQMHCPQTC